MSKQVKLGLFPIGKFVFSHKHGIEEKENLQKKLRDWNVSFVDLDDVLKENDGLVRSQEDAEKAISFMKTQNVDAIFLPHCNFGTEGAAGIIAKAMSLPILLWGSRDKAPNLDGTRDRDTLCGLFPSSKVIRKMVGNKYTYIENSTVDSNVFKEGFINFIKAAAVVKAARNMKIGLLGGRIDFFWSCIVNESELLEKFGIQVVPFEIGVFLERVYLRVEKEKPLLEKLLAEYKDEWLDPSGVADDELILGVAAAEEIFAYRDEHNLSCMAVENFFTLGAGLKGGAAIYSAIVNEKFPLADESDIHGAVTNAMLAAVAEGDPIFFPEYVVRHPEDDNTVCLWHTNAPASIRADKKDKVSIQPPWILPGEDPVQLQMPLKKGHLTVCRFDGETGDYRFGIGEGEIVDGPKTRDFYGWMKVANWARWERQLVEGPYVHHCSAAYGSYTAPLIEACKYLDIPVEIYGE